MKNKWVFVTVFQRKSKVYVNVFGYPTKREALAHQRRSMRSVARGEVSPTTTIIAARVRPIIDDDYIAERSADA